MKKATVQQMQEKIIAENQIRKSRVELQLVERRWNLKPAGTYYPNMCKKCMTKTMLLVREAVRKWSMITQWVTSKFGIATLAKGHII